MKSIVEESSSIAKAIENGWIRAGKPQEFTVRIFEEPEKGFLGITKKPAKIGIFYKDSLTSTSFKHTDTKPHHEKRAQIAQQAKPRQPQKQPSASMQFNTQQPVQAQPQQPVKPVQEQQEIKKPKWTPEMVNNSKEWMDKMLTLIEHNNIPFTIEQKNYYLSIKFSSHVLPDKRKEQVLFKHWSYLLLQAMRHKFKRGLHGFKVVITSPA